MRAIGHIYSPEGNQGAEWTHASTPTAWHVGADTWRVFYASRDRDNRGHIFSLDIDMRDPLKYFNVQGPLASPGERGTFDDCGLSPACVDRGRLYYLGWNLTKTAPFMNTIGSLAIDDGRLLRDYYAPVLNRDEHDPISLAYPYIVGDSMFYSSNTVWGEGKNDMRYEMKVAHRRDFDEWVRHGEVVLLPKDNEVAVVRPSVLVTGNEWEMWYSSRDVSGYYVIRYATNFSKDCPTTEFSRQTLVWANMTDQWESESQTYPNVFRHRDRTYMLYNGNGYGKTGFGIAEVIG